MWMPYSLGLLTITAALALAGCKKSNDLNVNGGKSNQSCQDGQQCAGSCVEGICREFCDNNYNCEGGHECEVVDNVAICLPPDAQWVDASYAPLDLLSDCTSRDGCEVQLDPAVRGSFKRCSDGGVTLAQVLDGSFDFATACSETGDMLFELTERVAYDHTGFACNEVTAVGMADGTAVEGCSSNEWSPAVKYSKLIEKDGETYLLRGGPRPHTGPEADDWYGAPGEDWWVDLYRRVGDAVTGPELCTQKPTCSLPNFPRIGEAASQYAGLWVECDGDLLDCDATWSEAALNNFRRVYYIREDGFGEMFQKSGPASDPQSTTCTAAFRVAGAGQVLILGKHAAAIGELAAERRAWGTTSEGGADYLVEFWLELDQTVFDPEGWLPTAFYKRVELPENFVDPCAAGLPSFDF